MILGVTAFSSFQLLSCLKFYIFYLNFKFYLYPHSAYLLFYPLSVHQYSSDQKKILKEQTALCSLTYINVNEHNIQYIYIYIYMYIYIYIYIYILYILYIYIKYIYMACTIYTIYTIYVLYI